MAGESPNNNKFYENPMYKPDVVEVDGDRPRILNETIVGPNCGGGSPTVFMGKKGGKLHCQPSKFS
jgi:hypothetical protein